MSLNDNNLVKTAFFFIESSITKENWEQQLSSIEQSSGGDFISHANAIREKHERKYSESQN